MAQQLVRNRGRPLPRLEHRQQEHAPVRQGEKMREPYSHSVSTG
jgi:hypothetical protein